MNNDPTTIFTAEATVPPQPLPAAPPITLHDDTDSEPAREEAFSEDFFWNGEPLQPFSLERYNVFVCQRLALGAPSLGTALQDGAAFFPDALRLIWLCCQPPAAIARLRRAPEEMQAAIEAWAAESAPVSRSAEVLDTGIRLFNSAFETRHEARPARNKTGIPSGN